MGAAVRPGSRLISDDFKGYAGLHDANRHHPVVQGEGRNAERFMPIVHVLFSNVKTWLNGTYHGVSAKHLPRYAREWNYRFNRRTRIADPADFVLGLSTRKVAKALLPVLGTPVSASTVSRVAKTLDAAVAAFHARPLSDQYRVLMLDGVVLARKTGAGSLRRPVLVALGLGPDARKEIIDFRLARAESAREWETFLTDLHRRGLSGEALELITVDGGAGLLAALPFVYPAVPVQRC